MNGGLKTTELVPGRYLCIEGGYVCPVEVRWVDGELMRVSTSGYTSSLECFPEALWRPMMPTELQLLGIQDAEDLRCHCKAEKHRFPRVKPEVVLQVNARKFEAALGKMMETLQKLRSDLDASQSIPVMVFGSKTEMEEASRSRIRPVFPEEVTAHVQLLQVIDDVLFTSYPSLAVNNARWEGTADELEANLTWKCWGTTHGEIVKEIFRYNRCDRLLRRLQEDHPERVQCRRNRNGRRWIILRTTERTSGPFSARKWESELGRSAS